MSEKTELQISARIEPDELTEAHVRIPHDGNYYIPVTTNGTFEKEEPAITLLGEGAVRMSLKQQFGFMRGIPDYRVFSQKTDAIVIEPSDEPSQWRVSFETSEPATETDLELYRLGMDVYATFAAFAIARAQDAQSD